MINDDIWQRLAITFASYDYDYNIISIMFSAILIPFVVFLILRMFKPQQNQYANLFPSPAPRVEKLNLFSPILLGGAFVFYVGCLYSSEMSFFKDLDSMWWTGFQKQPYAINILPIWHRFFPLGHSEWLVLYNLTTNFYILNLFLVAQFGLVAYLSYRLLDFLSINQRLAIVTLIILSPSIFNVFNGQMFPERNSLMLLLLGLNAFKKFSRDENYKFLWLGVLCFDLMLYYKETNILIILGILIVSFMYNFLCKNIKIKDFFLIKNLLQKFPLEILLGICCFIFFVFFNHYMPKENGYLNSICENFAETIKIYVFEIILFGICVILFLGRVCKIRSNPLFNEGLFLGGTLLLGYLIEKRVFHIDSYMRHAYLAIISTLCFIIYIATNIKNKKVVYALTMLGIVYSIPTDYNKIRNEEGKEYRKVFDFISEKFDGKKEVYLDLKRDNVWYYISWNNAWKYYHPDKKITFKTDNIKKSVLEHIIKSDQLENGDFYVRYKGFVRVEKNLYQKYEHNKIFESKSFDVYEIQKN